MPLSRKRKKNGKKVKHDPGTHITVDPNAESGVSLQDLINVLAYQEHQKKQQNSEAAGIEPAVKIVDEADEVKEQE